MDNKELQTLKAQNEALAHKLDLVMQVVDQNKLARLSDKEDVPMKIRITLNEGYVVNRWETVTDIVDYTGRVEKEDQVKRIYYLVPETDKDGKLKFIEKSKDMPLVAFYKNLQWVQCEVESMTVDKDKKTWYTFIYNDNPYRIANSFINK